MLNQQIQNYTIVSPLGEGGMAMVYLAEHNLLGNKTAIKLLNNELVRNENIRKRFLAEARSMARMSHPNIIKVSDLIEQGDMVAFVMEYVEGETLKEYIERKGKLTEDEIKALFSQMLDALGYVHDQNLVHRDIKPSNFMIDSTGKVKLMDFGIAKTTDTSSSEYTQTGTGVQMGTPMYMSPEQITETKSVTPQSDIYSLGVVLWQMVTGEKPYDTRTLTNFQLQMCIVNENLPLVNNTNWDNVIEKATSKNPVDRFETCADFRRSLSNFQDYSIENIKISDDDKTMIQSNDTHVSKETINRENTNLSDEITSVETSSITDSEKIKKIQNLLTHAKSNDDHLLVERCEKLIYRIQNKQNIENKQESSKSNKEEFLNKVKIEIVDYFFKFYLKNRFIEVVISLLLCVGVIGFFMLPIYIYRYIKAKKRVALLREKLSQNPALYNAIACVSTMNTVVISVDQVSIEIPQIFIWFSKYSKKEAVKIFSN
jgi:serine/threonine protein kinase